MIAHVTNCFVGMTFLTISAHWFGWSIANIPPPIRFPPPISVSENQNFPTGHLQPLGRQRAPDGPVKEYFAVIRGDTFWEDHVSKGIPLVFRQGIGESPALLTWTDDYLRENYGDLDVLIELKEENRSHSARRMTIMEFLSRYKEEDIYIVTVLPDPMRRDIQVPPCLLCGTFLDYVHETNFWMSSGGTRSVIHYDADHNLHCLVAGRKDFIMIEKKYYSDLYFLEKNEYSGSGFSEIDPNKINLLEYPNVAKVPWTYATLMSGDCIYIPAEYIHQVRSYNRTISATILFTSGPLVGAPFEPKGCNREVFEYTPLSDLTVHWTYNKGDRHIEMGYMNIEVLRYSILATMQEKNEELLTKESFTELWEQYEEKAHEHDKDGLSKDPRRIFDQYLDTEGRGFLTKHDILQISRETLKTIARLVDPPHGPESTEEENTILDGKVASHEEL